MGQSAFRCLSSNGRFWQKLMCSVQNSLVAVKQHMCANAESIEKTAVATTCLTHIPPVQT